MAAAMVETVPLSFGTTRSRLSSFEPVGEDILIMLDTDNTVEVYLWSDAVTMRIGAVYGYFACYTL